MLVELIFIKQGNVMRNQAVHAIVSGYFEVFLLRLVLEKRREIM